jgi:hypothetical protein
MIRRELVVLVAVIGALVGAVADAADGGVERLYTLDCGQNIGKDQSRWPPRVNEGKAIEFSDNCYLIKHAKNPPGNSCTNLPSGPTAMMLAGWLPWTP